MTIALCFTTAWLTLLAWNPYCDCWTLVKPFCPGPSPYAACEPWKEEA